MFQMRMGCSGMKLKLLNSKRVALVDPQSWNKVAGYRWYIHKGGWVCGFKNDDAFVKLHQVILPPRKGKYPDHKDGNKLDNRKQNLRLATKSQNAQNSRKRFHKNATSKYKGVGLNKRVNLWQVRIKPPGKVPRRSIGYFKSQVVAARAYDAAARKYFGRFARTNFV